jgi:hypothetical protein
MDSSGERWFSPAVGVPFFYPSYAFLRNIPFHELFLTTLSLLPFDLDLHVCCCEKLAPITRCHRTLSTFFVTNQIEGVSYTIQRT